MKILFARIQPDGDVEAIRGDSSSSTVVLRGSCPICAGLRASSAVGELAKIERQAEMDALTDSSSQRESRKRGSDPP